MGVLLGLVSLLLLGCNALVVLTLSKYTALCVYDWPKEAVAFVYAIAAAGWWMVALSSDDVLQPAILFNLSIFLSVLVVHCMLHAESLMQRLKSLPGPQTASVAENPKAAVGSSLTTPVKTRQEDLLSPATPTTPVLPGDRKNRRRTSELERQEKVRRYLGYAVKDDVCREQYMEFARQEFTSESVQCLYAGYLLHKKTASSMPMTELLEELQQFYDTFVAADAPEQVNVSSQQRRKFANRLRDAKQQPEGVERADIMDWVDAITREVEDLVLNDAFPRFMQSPNFQTFLHTLEAARKLKPRQPIASY